MKDVAGTVLTIANTFIFGLDIIVVIINLLKSLDLRQVVWKIGDSVVIYP